MELEKLLELGLEQAAVADLAQEQALEYGFAAPVAVAEAVVES